MKAAGGRRGEVKRARASVRVRLAPVRTAPSRGDTCQPAALKIAFSAGAGAGGGAGLRTFSGHILGPWALVFLSLAGCHSDLCLEWLGRGLGSPFCRVCVWGWGLGWGKCLPGLGMGGVLRTGREWP